MLADVQFTRDCARDEVAAAQGDGTALELAQQDLADHDERLEAVEMALTTLENCASDETIEPKRG